MNTFKEYIYIRKDPARHKVMFVTSTWGKYKLVWIDYGTLGGFLMDEKDCMDYIKMECENKRYKIQVLKEA